MEVKYDAIRQMVMVRRIFRKRIALNTSKYSIYQVLTENTDENVIKFAENMLK
jgi:hypothetical protein